MVHSLSAILPGSTWKLGSLNDLGVGNSGDFTPTLSDLLTRERGGGGGGGETDRQTDKEGERLTD